MGVYIRNITKEQFVEDCNEMGVLVITEGISEIDLVRCGECKWGNKDNEGTLWCEHAIGGIMKPTDFCSYGERRADDD